jgi:hypothetical protein
MSHYNEIKTQITNRSALVTALTQCGFTLDQIEVHDEAQNLKGYRGDTREQKANVIIRRKDVGTASNDLGFAQKKDGTYEAIISDYDKRRYNDKWLDKVCTKHSVENAKQAFAQNGWEYTESVDDQGRTQLVGVSY